MQVQYTSLRPGHTDHLYGTGAWELCEVKEVPDDLGAKMLRHSDVYARPEGEVEGVQKVVMPEPHEEDPMLEVLDRVNTFTMDQAKDFIKEQFNISASKRQYSTVGEMRAYALQLANQYGVH